MEELVSTPVLEAPVRQVSGLRQILYIAIGFLFVGLAILGAIIPVMPCTPFVLTASYFFDRSSPRLHRWLRRVPYFGHVIRDWETHRGIRLSIKIFAVCCVTAFITYTIAFSNAPVLGKWSCGLLGAVGVGVILFGVKTVGRADPVTGRCFEMKDIPTDPSPGRLAENRVGSPVNDYPEQNTPVR